MEKSISILSKLATAQNRRDEIPNVELAIALAESNNKAAVKELVENLHHKKKDIQHDCIKVLYETGTRNPALIAPYANDFIALLESKNNRMQWGAMTALSSIALENPKVVYASLSKILAAADRGSVITKDYAVMILIKLSSLKEYQSRAFALLLEQLQHCATNQLPMYAERAMLVVNEKNKTLFVKTLEARLSEIEKESKRKRVEKVIRKFRK